MIDDLAPDAGLPIWIAGRVGHHRRAPGDADRRVLAGGAAAGTLVASADPSLPDRSAAQLLVDVQTARVDGLSGTIVESADLGLPSIAGTSTGGADGLPVAGLAALLTGSNTARVWYAGEEKMRLALIGTQGETDVIRNGSDAWLWNSSDKTATHVSLPADHLDRKPGELAGGLATTPQQAAEAALSAIEPTTEVSTTGAAKVAGRDAYELVLSPKDTASLIGQVRLAIDAEHHIPLRVDVYPKNATSPAVRVAFQQISFAVPDDEQFAFNPPTGTKVTEQSATPRQGKHPSELTPQQKAEIEKLRKQAASSPDRPRVIGSGWASIVEAKLPKVSGTQSQRLDSVLGMLTKVSGSWGSGHVFAGTLFSVLVTDDGRAFAGAVAPEKLYEAATK